MRKNFIVDSDNKILQINNNISQMNVFEYLWCWIKDWGGIKGALLKYVKSIGGIIVSIFTFVISTIALVILTAVYITSPLWCLPACAWAIHKSRKPEAKYLSEEEITHYEELKNKSKKNVAIGSKKRAKNIEKNIQEEIVGVPVPASSGRVSNTENTIAKNEDNSAVSSMEFINELQSEKKGKIVNLDENN